MDHRCKTQFYLYLVVEGPVWYICFLLLHNKLPQIYPKQYKLLSQSSHGTEVQEYGCFAQSLIRLKCRGWPRLGSHPQLRILFQVTDGESFQLRTEISFPCWQSPGGYSYLGNCPVTCQLYNISDSLFKAKGRLFTSASSPLFSFVGTAY